VEELVFEMKYPTLSVVTMKEENGQVFFIGLEYLGSGERNVFPAVHHRRIRGVEKDGLI
jgi:hypothetical protein